MFIERNFIPSKTLDPKSKVKLYDYVFVYVSGILH